MNQQEREAGSGDNGVSLDFGEIAIDPTGSYALSSSRGNLVHAPLAQGEPKILEALSLPNRVAFAHDRHTLFATRSLYETESEGELVRYDLRTDQVAWRRSVEIGYGDDGQYYGTFPWLTVTADDERLVVVHERSVQVLDAGTGKVLSKTGRLPSYVRDVDLTPDESALVIALAHSFDEAGQASAEIVVWELATDERTTITVPNCADEVTLSKDGKTAFMAPTRCQRDPVSVIDLEHRRFVRNLPGFGPVALSPNGALGVAFIDRDAFDASLMVPGDPEPRGAARYHLMLIDPATLRYETVELGDDLPRYAVAPDGKMLFIDDPYLWTDGRIRVLDIATKRLKKVLGPSLVLDQYVVKSDASELYLLDRGLFRVSLSDLTASAVPLSFTPKRINITPDDHTLVLRASSRRLWLFDTVKGKLGRRIDLDVQGADLASERGARVSVDVEVDFD